MQNLLVAVAVLVAALYSGWSLMPSRPQLRLLQRADERLYRAKNAGRNCIVIDDGVDKTSSLPIA